MIQSHFIEYNDGSVLLEGYYAFDTNRQGQRPIILVVHDWAGRREWTCQKADMLAEWGYVGFAIDMYGKGTVGATLEESKALMQPFIADRSLLKQRMMASVLAIKQIEQADCTRMGAVGFCFGGLCALDLARSGVANVKGVVSCHGQLDAPEHLALPAKIDAQVLVLHGYDDPMISPQKVLHFADEMTRARADWQIVMYGQTMHAFMNPLANQPDKGILYHPKADARAWVAIQHFFKGIE